MNFNETLMRSALFAGGSLIKGKIDKMDILIPLVSDAVVHPLVKTMVPHFAFNQIVNGTIDLSISDLITVFGLEMVLTLFQGGKTPSLMPLATKSFNKAMMMAPEIVLVNGSYLVLNSLDVVGKITGRRRSEPVEAQIDESLDNVQGMQQKPAVNSQIFG
jgi:hypothetical protein